MVKKALLALSLAGVLAAGPSSAAHTDVDQAMRAFTSAHGPEAMLALEAQGRGLEFAGLFASDPIPGDHDLAALTFLSRWEGLMGFDAIAHLEPERVQSVSMLSFVWLRHVHDSIPVMGSGVKVTLDPWGRIRQVSSSYKWVSSWADSTPGLTPDQALDAMGASLPDLVPTGQHGLVYLVGGAGEARLAWVMRSHASTGPEAPAAYIDAHTGEVLMVWETNIHADGNVYDPNPVADPTVHRRELLNLTSTTNLDGQHARSYSCSSPGGGWDMCPSPRLRHADPDTSGHYLFSPDEPSTTDPFSEVMGYYHLDKIITHMRDDYGFVYRSVSGWGPPCGRTDHMPVDIHMNMDYENAWFGDENDDGCRDLTIGQGTYDYGYDASIIYHEYGHGINGTYSDMGFDFDILGPDYSPSGVNEAFADYWAASLTGRAVIGEYAGLGIPGELGIRDLSEFASCPDSMYGEGHYDSPMLSSCLWEIHEAIGQNKTDRLSLAVLGSLSDEPDFDEVGRALLSQASSLESLGVLTSGDVAAIDAAVASHTLVGCERIVVMEDGDRHLFFAQGWGRWVPEVPSGVQFMLYAPRGATRATAFLTTYSTGNYTVYVRRDAPVHFSVTGWPDVVITVEEYDFEFAGSPERVSFTEWSDPVVEEDTEYYFTYVHDSDFMMMDVEARIAWIEVPDADEDVIEDPTGDPATDAVGDVPVDPSLDTAADAPTDVGPDGGSITETKGCGCTIVR